ncbi:MAG: cbb3-type cytochrome c oxidase subunit 3 [Pseudomonadota bacterium]
MYETLSQFAQTGGLLLFVLAFGLVLLYALNPGNKQKFDEAKQIPLNDTDQDNG